MRCLFLISVLFMVHFCNGQNANEYDSVDNKMSKIPDSLDTSTTGIANFINLNFKSDDEKARAVFYWTATNISYDVENMFNQKPQTFQEKITKTLKSRKGICMHYVAIFQDIASKVGIQTMEVDGYTKQLGKVVLIPHAWCVSKIDGKWFLIDPTWGSGFVNGQKFYKKLTNTNFKANPFQFITSRIPFDYMWQLLDYPINNQEFYDDKTKPDAPTEKYDYNSAIEKYINSSEFDQNVQAINRIEQNGLKNKLIIEQWDLLKNNNTVINNNNSINPLKNIVSELNNAGALFNQFIAFRNKQFKPTVTEEELKSKIQIPYDKIVNCQEGINKITNISKENRDNFNSLKKAIMESKKQFQVQLDFVNAYLAKNNSDREKTFIIKMKKKK